LPGPFDFPLSPVLYQIWTAPSGAVYVWNGTAWVVGTYNSTTQNFSQIGGILAQCRTLLQDVSLEGSEYRYSDDSLIMNLNMGLLEMFRIRPDIFLSEYFAVPQYTIGQMDTTIPIEQQFVPSLIYYIVGLTQLRDDEGEQDARASSFLGKFTSMLVAVA
jgi:hypothetical protein